MYYIKIVIKIYMDDLFSDKLPIEGTKVEPEIKVKNPSIPSAPHAMNNPNSGEGSSSTPGNKDEGSSSTPGNSGEGSKPKRVLNPTHEAAPSASGVRRDPHRGPFQAMLNELYKEIGEAEAKAQLAKDSKEKEL